MKFMYTAICQIGLVYLIVFSMNAMDIKKNISEDLNDDNQPEVISLLVKVKSGQFTLTINNNVINGKMYIEDEGNLEKEIGIHIIDFDKRDKFREIEIFYDGERYDLRHYYYYSFDGNNIYELINTSGGRPTYSGYGIVLEHTWLDFWNQTEKYILNDQTHRLDRIDQAFYYVGTEATVLEMFPIYRKQSDKDVVANLSPSSQCVILLYDSSGWYLIKSKSGLVGWTKDLSKLQLPNAG